MTVNPQIFSSFHRPCSQSSKAIETKQLLNISENCTAKLNEICTENSVLRVTVDNGGCSGFQYKFDLDTKINEDDVLLGPGNKVVVDSVSLEYCAGSTLEYHSELIRSGFRIVNNPKAEAGCSCGASFALRLD